MSVKPKNTIWVGKMDEVIDSAVTLNERAVLASGDVEELNKMIADYRSFLHGCAAQYASNGGSDRHDELFEVAQIAFSEAIKSYDINKGNFYSFAMTVIRKRMIDELRKYYRYSQNVVLYEDYVRQEQENGIDATSTASMRQYELDESNRELVYEIEQFKTELARWGITLQQLVKASPKHRRFREQCLRAARIAAGDSDIMQTFHLKNYLPVKKISDVAQVSPKKLERMRAFIIATLIVMSGDYSRIADYIHIKDEADI